MLDAMKDLLIKTYGFDYTKTTSARQYLRKDPYMIRFVPEEYQEESMCIAAVEQDGMLLSCVKKQTPAICEAAVKQNPTSVGYVQHLTQELYDLAISMDPSLAELGWDKSIERGN